MGIDENVNGLMRPNKELNGPDLVERSAIAENEVDGALNEAVVEVVKALVVVEGVLAAVEAAVVKSGFRPRYPQRRRLPARRPHHVRRRVLHHQYVQKKNIVALFCSMYMIHITSRDDKIIIVLQIIWNQVMKIN